MGLIASQIISLTIVYSTVYSGTDQRKHQSSASLAFVRGIHRRPVNSPHKRPVTRKMFPFDDAIMLKSRLFVWIKRGKVSVSGKRRHISDALRRVLPRFLQQIVHKQFSYHSGTLSYCNVCQCLISLELNSQMIYTEYFVWSYSIGVISTLITIKTRT